MYLKAFSTIGTGLVDRHGDPVPDVKIASVFYVLNRLIAALPAQAPGDLYGLRIFSRADPTPKARSGLRGEGDRSSSHGVGRSSNISAGSDKEGWRDGAFGRNLSRRA